MTHDLKKAVINKLAQIAEPDIEIITLSSQEAEFLAISTWDSEDILAEEDDNG